MRSRSLLIVVCALVGLAGAVALLYAARSADAVHAIGDQAVIELRALAALDGTLRPGASPESGWRHPGPLFVYYEAVWYALSGYQTAGIQAGALFLNLLALVVMFWTMWRRGAVPLVVTVVAATTVYVWRLGDVVVSAWLSHVALLPMMALIVVAAAAAAARRWWFLAAAVVVLLWALPIGGHSLPAVDGTSSQSLGQALGIWGAALVAPWTPAFVRAWGGYFFASPLSLRPAVAGVEMVLLGIVLWSARRGERPFEMWFAGLCLAASVVAFVSVTRLGSPVMDYAVFWIGGVGVLITAVLGGAVAAENIPRMSSTSRAARTAACVGIVLCAFCGAAAMRTVVRRSAMAFDDRAVVALADGIARYVAGHAETSAVIAFDEPEWPLAVGAILQLRKAGVAVAVESRWISTVGERFAPTGREPVVLTIADATRHNDLAGRPGNETVVARDGIFVDAATRP